MKKVLSLILRIVFITTLLPIASFTASAVDEISWSLNDEGVLHIIGCSNKVYESFPWDDRRDEIKSIVFSTGYIPEGAFENCTALESVTIPGTVSVVGERAFAGCTSLKSVTLACVTSCGGITTDGHGTGACVTYYTDEIRDYAFAGCTSLEKIVIDGGLKNLGVGVFDDTAYANDESNWENGGLYIKGYFIKAKNTGEPICVKRGTRRVTGDAFKNCNKVKEIILSEGITGISTGLFADCTALKKLVVSYNEINIPDGEFANCENLVIICVKDSAADKYATANNIECVRHEMVGTSGDTMYWTLNGDGVLELAGKGAMYDYGINDYSSPPWYNYRGKVKEIKIGQSITSIGDYAFDYTSATKVEIPDSVTKIGAHAFEGSSLKSVNIPDGVTSIGRYAFYKCVNLEKLTIPKTVTSIGEVAFAESGAYVEVAEENKDYASHDGSLYNKEKTKLISVSGAVSGEFTVVDSVETIVSEAFCNNTAIDKVVFGEDSNLKNIENGAFYGCNSVTHLDIPKGVTILDIGALAGMRGLESVTLPEGLTEIGGSAFAACTSLKEITIPDSVTSVGEAIFRNCTGLKNVKLSTSITNISYAMFYNCTILTNVTIPEGVTSIGGEAFYNCRYLHGRIVIPNGVTSIGRRAFYTTYIREVELPESLTSIGDAAFSHCPFLESITIPKSANTIGTDVFKESKNLKTIYCYKNSAAHRCALEHNIKCVFLDEPAEDSEEIVNPTPSIIGGGGDSKPKKPVVGLANFKTVNTYDNSFTDVESDAWYYDSIKIAYELDLVNGKGGDKYDPAGNMTIAEAITLVARIHSIYKTGKGFFDPWIPWYEVYVDYAIENDIIAEDRFTDFNAPVTRIEFAEIFAKAVPEDDLNAINNIEKGSIPDVAESDAVYLLYNAGILTGSDEAHSFKPESNIQRSEVATIVTRIVDKEKRVTFEID